MYNEMAILDCDVGDIVSTGDAYGMDVCVCIKAKTEDPEQANYFRVTFLCLTDGKVHTAGHAPGCERYSDDCFYVGHIAEQELELVKKQWGVQ